MSASAKWVRARGMDRDAPVRLRPWQVYLFAVAATAITLWIRVALKGELGARPTLIVFTLPIMLSAYIGGLRGGLSTTLLCALGADDLLLTPVHSFVPASSVERWQLFFLVLAGVVMTMVNEALQRARRRADTATEEHRQAEAAVRASEARLRMATDNARVGLVMVDHEHRYLFANTTYAEILGLASPDIVGQRVADVLAPLYEEQIRPRLDRAFAGERVVYELHRPAPEGLRHYAVKYEPARVNGSVPQVVVVITDITERKLAEIAARMLAAIVESSDDAIIGKTLDGVITSWNKGAEKLFGYSQEEAIGCSMLMIFPPDRFAEEPQIIAKIAQGQSIEHFETVRVRKDGKSIQISATISAIRNASGLVVGASKIARDITERKRAVAEIQRLNAELEQRVVERTAQLEMANKELEAYSSAVARDLRVAEAADRTKSLFLATMSHELRTPLNSIIGFTSIVLQEMVGPLNAEQSRQLGMVKVSAKHLLELINDVLDLSKIEAGQLETHAEPFDVRASIERVTASIRPLADKKGLLLTSTACPLLGVMVSDRRRVEQILLNILSNAVKFTESGGVDLTAERVAGFQSRPDAMPRPVLRLRVTDTGIGMKPEDVQNLFQPFRQIDSSLARQNEGTGLGLAISRRLASLLGGEILAESELSRGSVFTVILPLQESS